MAAGLAVPVSGPYLGTWNALTLGVMDDNGFVLRCVIHGQEMNRTDQFGQTLVEGVYQGQDWRARFNGLEFKAGLLAALQAFGAADRVGNTLNPTLSGVIVGLQANGINVGDLFTNYANPLVLTAVLGNPPTAPQSLTATNAIVAPEMNTEMSLTSKIRELPLELCLIPYNTVIGSISNAVPFTCI